MSEDNLPRILIVDDGETSAIELGLEMLATTRAMHPRDVQVSNLEWADLVLMDFILDKWAERDKLEEVSLKPLNGLALAAVLREHADAANNGGYNYTAFAIHSGHIGEISARLHTTNLTPYVVARLNNLEWVFDKADESRFARSADLADAVRNVSALWLDVEERGFSAATAELLKLAADAPWSERASDDVVLCQIPLSNFSAGTNGLLFLRWLLHGILPYPTFLLARHWVAARLRINPGSLSQVLQGGSELANELAACQYQGVLAAFDGPRWWRAALDQYVWDLRAQGMREPAAFHAELERRAGVSLERVDGISPAVCVDGELKLRDGLRALESVVRLVPDLWPAYADPAYAEVGEVRENAALRSIVHPLDRERVLDLDEEE
ncbi:hypothetical protein [Cyanobium sp. ULC082]